MEHHCHSQQCTPAQIFHFLSFGSRKNWMGGRGQRRMFQLGLMGRRLKHIDTLSQNIRFSFGFLWKKCLIGLSYLFRLRWWRRPSMMRRLPVTTAITGGRNPKTLSDCSNTTISKRCSTSYKTTYEAQQEEECGENFKWVNCVICKGTRPCRSSDQEVSNDVLHVDLHCSGMVCFCCAFTLASSLQICLSSFNFISSLFCHFSLFQLLLFWAR